MANLPSPKTVLRKLLTTKVGRGSLVMLVGSFAIGGFSFLFNPIMGVLLGPEGYGEVQALLSLQIIFSVPALTLNTVLIKFAARYQAKNNLGAVKALFFSVSKKLFYLSLLGILLSFVAKDTIGSFLQVHDSNLIVLLGFLTIATFFFTLNSAFLQGLLQFVSYTFANFIQVVLRILFAVVLIYLGFGVGGVVAGMILSIVSVYLISLYFLRDVLKVKTQKEVKRKEILSFIGPALFSLLGLTLLNNIDVILVKHFFSPVEAGFYSAGVVTSRVIVFAALPITQVIFPLIVQRYEAKRPYHHLVLYALGITTLIGVVISTIYFFYPSQILKIFFFYRSEEYLGAAPIMGIFAVVVAIYSLNTLLTYLFLSINKVRFASVPFIGGVVMGLVIWFNHSSLAQVVWSAIWVNLVLLILLLGYYQQIRKQHYER